MYLAYKDGAIAGRIAAIINWNEVNLQGKKKVRFGWWDVIDEVEVTQALLQKVYELGQQHQLDHVEGPMGFSNLDKVGVLNQGFDFIGSMITWYNYPYYVSHLEQLGFVKEKEYLESLAKELGIKVKNGSNKRVDICNNIMNKLIELEKYSKGKNKMTYIMVPSNHPKFPRADRSSPASRSPAD